MPDESRCLTDGPEAVRAGEGNQSIHEPSARLADSYAFDEDYVRRLAEGDRSVEDHFIAYFGELLTIKLRARVRSRAMVEEIRQETFARVFQTLRQKGGVKHPERFGAFVHGICNNILFEQFRYDKRHVPISPGSDDWPDRRIDMDERLISDERRRLVESVLEEIPKRYRELLRMILNGANKAEACERLKMSDDNFRVLLHRSISRFRDKLAKREAPATKRFASGNGQDPVKRNRYPVHYTMRYSDGT